MSPCIVKRVDSFVPSDGKVRSNTSLWGDSVLGYIVLAERSAKISREVLAMEY